ncbi:MAG: DNA topoisomerase IV subunit A [Sphaerochaetaceae bacterium]|jgi:topoisomerase-4 subunit A|nr:DNA topoisomerase IV subunit A [Sphaerochaetaceae bacterium]NLO60025.1 DNA topoisomerase IV subunit A [Spirochaetales bacterium]MDD2404841.1 DNA topoisomerase IV subunit A [Sphaerochaetaceae bacterium]MDD4258471.1 DNA topoisomerase IV subunit A [Sphaerochaetaceae bacterium]MDD4762948.1 DNA topoisomerase IV subunit A [Sphaerochaetaceae bacterium]
MAHAETVFKENFLEYASYVIKDRAIPDIIDGLKPVQRRILHSLFEMDDGKFHKVANVVGHAMRYHPHGDASIGDALVNLANMNLFIDKQGNFGNIYTGDEAAAPRYIECRVLPFAKKVLYNPELTEMVDSYDGRNKEPVVFPAKLPIVLIQGTEGIAVGMSTRILPHNLIEVIDAVAAVLNGNTFELYPDFPTGGLMDISSYSNGTGKVLIRAKLDTKDPKRIVIDELPYGVTTDKMIKSIEDAGKKGKIKIASINDYTAEKANIEITLARNTYSNEVVDALYAFTACEQSITVNPLVIKDNIPTIMTVEEMIHFHAKHLVEVLTMELQLQKGHLLDRLHARTLERIFVEERIYKRIEQKRTQEEVERAVITGFNPFKEQIARDVTSEDVERLLKIPIRRISLFDIEKNRAEIEEINAELEKIEWNLNHIIDYSLGFLDELKHMVGIESHKRKTEIGSFKKADVREAAVRDLPLRYDPENGYLGYGLKSGNVLLTVSQFDRILIIQKEGTYFVTDVPEKLFVGKALRHCGFADKEELEALVFTIIYQEKNLKYLFIKRCRITQFILNKTYELLPGDDYKLYTLSTLDDARITILYKKGKGYKNLEDRTYFSRFLIKGVKANGVRLTTKEAQSLRIKHEADPQAQQAEPSLFADIDPFDDTVKDQEDE